MTKDLSSATTTTSTARTTISRKKRRRTRRRIIFHTICFFLVTCTAIIVWLFQSSSIPPPLFSIPPPLLSPSSPSQSSQWSSTYTKNYNSGGGREYIVGGRTLVVVGKQGEYVQRAIRDRLPQRNKGHPREFWDVIEDGRCLYNHHRSPDDTYSSISTKKTVRSLDDRSMNIPSVPAAAESRIQSTKNNVLLPDALLIGVQKGGTTALSDYLRQHPQVETNVRKELYFLDEVVDKVLISRERSSSSSSRHKNNDNRNSQRERESAFSNQQSNSTGGGFVSTADNVRSGGNGGGGGIPQRLIQKMYKKAIEADMQDDLLYDGRRHRHDRNPNHHERGYDTNDSSNNNHEDKDGTEARHNYRKMIFDMTPNYIFYSDRLPQRISCILPWAKILVLLRDPIERARSQYDMKIRFVSNTGRSASKDQLKRRKHVNIPSFASYIEADIQALKETGVLQDWSVVDFDTFFNSSAMKEAWRTYLNSGLNAPVGMSLYALQVAPFFEFIPREQILVIKSENLQTRTDETFNHILDFLGLSQLSLQTYRTSNKGRGTEVDTTTRTLLKDVFEPFNRKLVELLGDEWDGVWKT